MTTIRTPPGSSAVSSRHPACCRKEEKPPQYRPLSYHIEQVLSSFPANEQMMNVTHYFAHTRYRTIGWEMTRFVTSRRIIYSDGCDEESLHKRYITASTFMKDINQDSGVSDSTKGQGK